MTSQPACWPPWEWRPTVTDLDPARVEASEHGVYAYNGTHVLCYCRWMLDEDEGRSRWPTTREWEAHFLSADDQRAREAGLICTGDGLTVKWVGDVLFLLGSWSSHGEEIMLDALPPALRARIKGGEADRD